MASPVNPWQWHCDCRKVAKLISSVCKNWRRDWKGEAHESESTSEQRSALGAVTSLAGRLQARPGRTAPGPSLNPATALVICPGGLSRNLSGFPFPLPFSPGRCPGLLSHCTFGANGFDGEEVARERCQGVCPSIGVDSVMAAWGQIRGVGHAVAVIHLQVPATK